MEIEKGKWYMVDRQHRYTFPDRWQEMTMTELCSPKDDAAVAALKVESGLGRVRGPVLPPVLDWRVERPLALEV